MFLPEIVYIQSLNKTRTSKAKKMLINKNYISNFS